MLPTLRRQLDPGIYCIHISGPFPGEFADHFGGFRVKAFPPVGGSDATEITGPLADQTALLSLLHYLDDTGLVLISIESIEDPAPLGVAEA